jgi:hypothetical protein
LVILTLGFNLFTVKLTDLFDVKIFVGRRGPLKSFTQQFLSRYHQQRIELRNPHRIEIIRAGTVAPRIDLSLPINLILYLLPVTLILLAIKLKKYID